MRVRLLSAIVLGASLMGCYTGSRPPRVGAAAKGFTVKDSDRSLALNQFRGQVVVLNFWASWCTPCVQELPSMMDMQDRLKANGVTVVGVSIDVDDAAHHRFLKQKSVNFLTVRDPEQKVAQLYGTSGWPETYVIDRQGVLRRKFVGPVNWDSPEVLQFLSKL